MSRYAQIAGGWLVVAMLFWSSAAMSYSRSSSINYTVGTHTLSGYSHTHKDIWDPDYNQFCIRYVYDDIYVPRCEEFYIEIYYPHVRSDLNAPTGFHGTTIGTGIYDAIATHAVTATNQSGTWTVTGRHYVLGDAYIQYCPSYSYCTPAAFVGTTQYSVGSNTTAQHATIPMTISRYTTTSLADGEADSILADATSVLQTNDGPPGDVACPIAFFRSGSIVPLTVGDGTIRSQEEQDAVMERPERVKVINNVQWCYRAPQLGETFVGCASGALVGGGMIVTKVPTNKAGSHWAHEYGHNQSRPHNPSTGYVMYEQLNENNRRITQGECAAMMSPLN